MKREAMGEGRKGRGLYAALFLLLSPIALLPSMSFAVFEREALAIEREIKTRIEDVLSKTLPPQSYLVNVKVEMGANTRTQTVRTNRTGGGNNPFNNNRFILPGVPVKRELTKNDDPVNDETTLPETTEAIVRKMLITILVAPDVSADQIRAIQDVVTTNTPFNPLRGDEIDIKTSSLLKSSKPQTPRTEADLSGAASPTNAPVDEEGRSWTARINWPMIAVMSMGVLAFGMFIVFLFGPVRAFLNRLLAVLPRVGEQAAYAVSNAPAKPALAGAGAGALHGNFNSNGRNSKAHESVAMPFEFIGEEHLSKLPILLRQLPANQSAVVLAYLSPEWASRVLNGLDTGAQSAVMQQLSQAREVPSEVVKDVEQQVKAKLPYLVGGTDWLQSVYQFTEPETQKALLGTLTQESPLLAQSLRRKSFFSEDLMVLAAAPLRMIVQEVGYAVMAVALKLEKAEARQALLLKLPSATREILSQELEVSVADAVAIAEAKAKIVAVGRRLLNEGRIALPEKG